ncbi:hypothetical protein BpHYR1_020294 [Brachionus plicatilis]|uniref:Uncharacterized protein n=1 Tax=Brachionus plicatilis TaxID=10195 RepID=A0A3M7PA45_BRAPC|nr:hypothetical protein BpHYR1_020294 [Brachionus plicatilis]
MLSSENITYQRVFIFVILMEQFFHAFSKFGKKSAKFLTTYILLRFSTTNFMLNIRYFNNLMATFLLPLQYCILERTAEN